MLGPPRVEWAGQPPAIRRRLPRVLLYRLAARLEPIPHEQLCFIISARSHYPGAGTGWGEYNADYVYNGGTSMSCPLVAGAAAIVRDWYNDVQGLATPTSALIKATLINGAVDISPGQYGTGWYREIPPSHPNNVIGWGRVNLKNAIMPDPPSSIWYDDHVVGLSTGQTVTYQALVNDLDLEVIGPDKAHYYGNGGLDPDRLNNVEDVVIAGTSEGLYRVVVRAHNVPQGTQPYAIVAVGLVGGELTSTPTPTLTSTPTVTGIPGPTGTPTSTPTATSTSAIEDTPTPTTTPSPTGQVEEREVFLPIIVKNGAR